MYAEGKAQRIGSLLHIVAPVAALLLLAVADGADAHHAALLAVGVNIIATDQSLSCVLHATDEVDDVLLLPLFSHLALQWVFNLLVVADVVPIVLVHLYLYAWCGGVLDHEPLADADEPVDVEPRILEGTCPIGGGVIVAPGRWHARKDGELALSGGLAPQSCVGVWRSPHAHLKVAKWVVEVEHGYDLDVILVEASHAEVAKEYMLNLSRLGGWCVLEATVRRVLVAHLHDTAAVSGEDDASDGEEEELHAGALLKETFRERVVQAEVAYILVVGVFVILTGYEAQSSPVTRHDVEVLALCRDHVAEENFLDAVWKHIVGTERYIMISLSVDIHLHGVDGLVVIEEFRRVAAIF